VNMPMPNESWNACSDQQKLEMTLEMLVDDELPQEQRAALLRSLDAMPGRWRDLAIRFLERQAEHTSVKAFMQAATDAAPEVRTITPAAPIPAVAGVIRPRTPWWNVRVAAGLLLLAGITTVIGFSLNRTGQPSTIATTPTTTEVQLAGADIGVPNKSIGVNVVKTDGLPNNLLQGSLERNGSRQIYIVPQGSDGAAIIPVTVAKPEVIY